MSFSGWLIDAREFEPHPEPTSAELDAIAVGLSGAASTCTALGIGYLPVLVPAKRNIVRAAPSSDRSWVGELNARVRDLDDVEIMNLVSVLRHAARHGPCYHRTDADWNDLGAFFVARALLKEAHKTVPELRPAPLADLHLRPVPSYRGTLIDAPKLQWLHGEVRDGEPDAEPEEGIAANVSRLQARRMPVEPQLAQAQPVPVRAYARADGEEHARLAVVGDTAALPVVMWLAERARRTTLFSSQTLPLAQLEIERPPLVIHLIREIDLLESSPL
ncbi:MAG: alginate O-acetyltransferase AlgX-related protein [Solirubrobacteraceae bacterium]